MGNNSTQHLLCAVSHGDSSAVEGKPGFALFRGIYPYLLMATNVPRSIFFGGGGNEQKV